MHCFTVYTVLEPIFTLEHGNVQREECLQRYGESWINVLTVVNQIERLEAGTNLRKAL